MNETRAVRGLRNLVSGLWGFFMRRQVRRDLKHLAVLGSPAGRQDVQGAKVMQKTCNSKNEAERSYNYT